MVTDHWLRKFYRRSYAIHHKRPKVCWPTYRKGYRSVGNLLGLVVGEDRSDYHLYLSSTVWITWRWKTRQPTYSRDKSPAGLLLTSWQTLRTIVRGEENGVTAKLIKLLYCCELVVRLDFLKEFRRHITYVNSCLLALTPASLPVLHIYKENFAPGALMMPKSVISVSPWAPLNWSRLHSSDKCKSTIWNFTGHTTKTSIISFIPLLKPHSPHPPPAPCNTSSRGIWHRMRFKPGVVSLYPTI